MINLEPCIVGSTLAMHGDCYVFDVNFGSYKKNTFCT